MKKELTILCVGLSAVAFSQNQVGINTATPQSTLDVKNANASGTTNEGIIAPILTKTRVANIATPVEGTLVYVNNTAYTAGSNTIINNRVANITEKGYYFYNGIVWVKAADTNLYNANGTLVSNRVVNQDGKRLTFQNGVINISGESLWAPLRINSLHADGAIVHLSGTDVNKPVMYRATTDGHAEIRAQEGTIFMNRDTGYVGIGTSLPSARLHVSGSARVTGIPAGESTDQIVTTDGDGNLRKRSVSDVVASGNFIQNQNSTTQSANYRISGTGIAGAFRTSGDLTNQGFVRINSGSETSTGWVGFYKAGETTDTRIGYIGSNNANMYYSAENGAHHVFTTTGNVGIGISSPTAKLHVAGNARITNIPTGASDDQIVTIDTDGNLRKRTVSSIDTNTTYTGSTSVTLNGTSFERAALTGDVTAAANSNATTVTAIQGKTVATTAPTNGQVLKWNGTAWTPSADTGLTTEVDGIVGNEVLNATANKGLTRAGDGTATSPYTLGLTDGTANGQVMKWNATTNSWAPAADTDTNTTYTGSTSVTLNGTSFERAALTGDVTAAANSNATTVTAIQGKAVATTAPTNGQVLKWNGTAWVPAVDENTNTTYTGSTSVTLSGTSFQRAALTGDVTATANSNTVTINNGAVTAAKLNQMGATSGQVLKWNGTAWAPAADDNTNTNTNIYTSNGVLSGARTVNLSGNNLMFLGEGNFGIGTSIPSAKLHVHGNARIANIPIGASDDQIVTVDTDGNLRKRTVSSIDTNTTYTAGNGLTLSGTEFSLPVTTSGTGNVVTGVTQTANGITVTKGNVNFTDTNTTYTAGNGLTLSNTEFSLPVATTGTGNVVTGVTQTANGITVTRGNVIDTNTTYTAGNGLTLSGTQFSMPVTTTGTGNVVTDVTQTANGITVTKGNANLSNTNIYNSNGTITTQRDVALSGQFLNFNNGYVQVNSANGLYAPLRVNSNHSEGAIMLLHPNNTANQVHVRATTAGDAVLTTNGGGYVWITKNTGNVGIGTSAPSSKLHVAGDIRTNAVIYNSDARLKKDVQNISNATATVNNLRSVTYHWNADGKKKGGNDTLQYGFIAQEVEKVLPALVNTDAEGYKSVNYVAVVPVLVKSLQEKDAEVKKLQTEMEQMKKEIEQIKQLLKK